MSVKPLVIVPDSRLFLCSEEVDLSTSRDEIKQLVVDMFDTMYHEGGIGLAAVQIGVHKRVFVVDIEANPDRYPVQETAASCSDNYLSACGKMVFINPKITEMSGDYDAMAEGCLSVPEQREVVMRPSYITMEYQTIDGETKVIKACGLLSRCLQHELDHLNGTVFLKHLSKFKRDMIMVKLRKAAARSDGDL